MFVILACNTSHYFLPRLKQQYPDINFVDIIECCAKNLSGIEKVLVLATEGTALTKLYDKYFEPYGIKVTYPNDVQEKIRWYIEVVKQNKIDDDTVKEFMSFIGDFEDEHIILGCTELPVIYNKGKKIYNPTQNIYSPIDYAINEIKILIK